MSAMNPWMPTRDGHDIDLLEPDLSKLTIEEVAHSLARINRYLGHTKGPVPYSVAQHSVLVSEHTPQEHALDALLHDAHEAITGDVLAPMKAAIRTLCRRYDLNIDPLKFIERRMDEAIRQRFGATPRASTDTKREDLRAVLTERRDLFDALPDLPWMVDSMPDLTPWPSIIIPWGIEKAEAQFLYTFRILQKRR